MAKIIDLREKIPANIVKWAWLEKTANEIYINFSSWEEKNAELINKFFNQSYFRGEESLIDKFIEITPDIKFDDIEQEWINLAILRYNNRLRDFRDCLNKITNDNIKNAFIEKIHNKVQDKLRTIAVYWDFDDPDKCQIPWDTNVLWYFQKVVSYLQDKEWAGGAKKALEVLKDINITNKDLNDCLLAAWSGIHPWTKLSDSSIPADLKDGFDALLSFEIGKEADRTINICKDIQKNFHSLLTNTFPAINTVVWEHDEYKYDESKLWDEYENKMQTINTDTNLSEKEKKKQIRDLRWEYYLKYLKSKNAKIGNALQQLYENNFDYEKIDRNILKDYIDSIADFRFRMLIDKWLLNEAFKVNFWNLDNFESFYKDLADIDKSTIELKDVDTVWTVQIPIQKKITQWPNEWLKDIDEFWKNAEKSYDALPIEYIINKADFDRDVLQKVTLEDKEKLLKFLSKFDQWDRYEIKWEDIGNLIYLYFVINNKNPLIEMDPEKQKEVENLFWKAKNREHKPWEDSEDDDEKNSEASNEDSAQKFKEKIEGMWPGKFENWSEIWLPMWKSELPGWWYQWMKIKISNVNTEKWTFKWTIFGWELKLGDKFEWKSREFEMNDKFFNDLNNISKNYSNKIYLQPNPDNLDFNSFRNSLNSELWTDTLSFPPTWVERTGDKFIQKIIDEKWKEKEVEVKYFWAESDDKSTYKIEYNPIKRNFTVSSSFNGDEKWKDWKSTKKRFSYKRDMDWNNFLIFFTQKWLTPQTEEEANNAINRQNQEFKMVNWGKRKLNWFSFNNIKNWFKDIFWALKKKMDEYDKNQTEKFKWILEWPLLNTLASLPLLPKSLKYAISERQQELYNEELNGARKEIELYLKALQSDWQFADTFDQVPPHVQTIYWKSYKEFIEGLFKKWNPSKEESRKAAALLLANFEKWGSPFRGLTEYENKWLWVKVLLWEAHYQQFLRDKAACIRDRDIAEATKSEDSKWLNEQLATCEMDYIINNVRWAIPKLPWSYFPSHEKRWIDWNDKTNYIANPSKRLLSETFANKLEDAKKWRYTKWTVEETYTKNKSINRFAIMEDEFSKCGSARYKQGAWALRRMFDLASNETLKKRAHKHFLTFLLSWILDVNCDPWLKKQVYGWAKPISFVPWMLVKEAWVAENVAILLDAATKWDFSKNITKYFHRNKQHNGSIDFKWLQWEIDTWLTDETMNKLNDYFSKLPTNDLSNIEDPHKKQILEKFKKSLLDEDVEEFDRWLLDNPTIVNNWLLTNINVVSDRLKFEDWEFKWKDSDDISNKRKFRNAVKNDITERDSSNPKDVNFVLDKYLSRFWLRSSENRQNIYKWVNTAYHYQKMVDESGWTYHCTHQRETETWKKFDFPLWIITQKDVDKLLLYAFEWKVRERLWWAILPEELKNALDTFQNFFKEAFKRESLKNKDVKDNSFKASSLWENDQFLLWWWDAYKKIREKELTNSNDVDDSENVDDYKLLKPSQRREITRRIFNDDDNNYINPEMESIYKTIKRKNNSLDEKWKLSIISDKQTRIINLQKKLAA